MNLPGQRHKGLAEICFLVFFFLDLWMLIRILNCLWKARQPQVQTGFEHLFYYLVVLLQHPVAMSSTSGQAFSLKQACSQGKLTAEHTALKASTERPSAGKQPGGDDGSHSQKNCKPNGFFLLKMNKNERDLGMYWFKRFVHGKKGTMLCNTRSGNCEKDQKSLFKDIFIYLFCYLSFFLLLLYIFFPFFTLLLSLLCGVFPPTSM